jgi:hypothetical protein
MQIVKENPYAQLNQAAIDAGENYRERPSSRMRIGPRS